MEIFNSIDNNISDKKDILEAVNYSLNKIFTTDDTSPIENINIAMNGDTVQVNITYTKKYSKFLKTE